MVAKGNNKFTGFALKGSYILVATRPKAAFFVIQLSSVNEGCDQHFGGMIKNLSFLKSLHRTCTCIYRKGTCGVTRIDTQLDQCYFLSALKDCLESKKLQFSVTFKNSLT